MKELIAILPNWIASALVPALAIVTFFWKGDEALSSEFRQWLGERIAGLSAASQEPTAAVTLSSIFDFIFGPRCVSLIGFLRISAVSLVAILIFYFMDSPSLLLQISILRAVGHWPEVTIVLIVTVIFEYLSIMKARVILAHLQTIRYGITIFFLLDIPITIVLVACFKIVSAYLEDRFFGMSFLGFLNIQGHIQFAFIATSFLIIVLSAGYAISLQTLKFFKSFEVKGELPQEQTERPFSLISIVFWVLPVKPLPVRSIGVMAGIIAFPVLIVVRLIR